MVTIDGGAMETIARIPELSGQVPEPAAPAPRQAFRRRNRPAFPIRSVAVLAVLAAVAWTLASWHEEERLRRQRQPIRLAREPAATAPESITP